MPPVCRPRKREEFICNGSFAVALESSAACMRQDTLLFRNTDTEHANAVEVQSVTTNKRMNRLLLYAAEKTDISM